METRNVTLTLGKAKEFYNSGSTILREVALQAFTEEELKKFDFKDITTFSNACEALEISTSWKSPLISAISLIKDCLKNSSKASIAMLKLNIIRQALNKESKLNLIEGDVYYPRINFATMSSTHYNQELKDGYLTIVGTVKTSDNNTYYVIGGNTYCSINKGLGSFVPCHSIGLSYANVGFLGCASREIARHMSIYFAKEIFEAMYGDYVDFKWI